MMALTWEPKRTNYGIMEFVPTRAGYPSTCGPIYLKRTKMKFFAESLSRCIDTV